MSTQSKQSIAGRRVRSNPLTDEQPQRRQHLILVLFVDKQTKRYEQNYKNKDNVVSIPLPPKKVCSQQLLRFKRHQKGREKIRRQQCHTMPFLLATCSTCTPHFFPHGNLYNKHWYSCTSASYFRHRHLQQLYFPFSHPKCTFGI